MNAHTPGPWMVMVPENRRGQSLPPRVIQEGKAGAIATMGITSTGDRDANARLIAAAPEMLDALKWAAEMMGYATYELKDEWRSRNGGDFDDALGQVRAAIAKAEGQP